MKYYKPPQKIKDQMEFWFLKYHRIAELDKKSLFGLYQWQNDEAKKSIAQKVSLKEGELIVFIFHNKSEEYIINTTQRFIKLTGDSIIELGYDKFKFISLDKTTLNQTKKIKRNEGEYTDCYLFTQEDEMTIWSIRTKFINAFIQNTKRCELIGRKYLKI